MRASDVILSSALVQIFMVAGVAAVGFFITAALLRRLNLLGAFCLVVLFVAGVVGAIVAGATYPDGSTDRQMTQTEQEAIASLAAGDPQEAYGQAGRSLLVDGSDRPLAWLTAARSAVMLGDLPAAGSYYGRLASLPEGELAAWGLSDSADEIDGWQQIEPLPRAEKRSAARAFEETVQQNARAQVDAQPGLAEATDNHTSLMAIEEQIDGAGEDGAVTGADELDARLEALLDRPGAEAARQLRIDNLVQQQRWEQLYEWLRADGARGLMDLADLTLANVIPQQVLADLLNSDGAGAAGELAQELAGSLSGLQRSAGDVQARLLLTLAELYSSEYLNDPERAMDIIRGGITLGEYLTADELAALQQLNGLRFLLDGVDSDLAAGALSDRLGDPGGGTGGSTTTASTGSTTTEPTTTGTTSGSLPDGLSGDKVRNDLTPFFNICAPQMDGTDYRMYLTMAEGSGGFPGGGPEATDFDFPAGLLGAPIRSMPLVANVERYTMLLID
jgi:hypothetical protein